jgi:hypothetical protein
LSEVVSQKRKAVKELADLNSFFSRAIFPHWRKFFLLSFYNTIYFETDDFNFFENLVRISARQFHVCRRRNHA